jgi:hypothetical protein
LKQPQKIFQGEEEGMRTPMASTALKIPHEGKGTSEKITKTRGKTNR